MLTFNNQNNENFDKITNYLLTKQFLNSGQTALFKDVLSHLSQYTQSQLIKNFLVEKFPVSEWLIWLFENYKKETFPIIDTIFLSDYNWNTLNPELIGKIMNILSLPMAERLQQWCVCIFKATFTLNNNLHTISTALKQFFEIALLLKNENLLATMPELDKTFNLFQFGIGRLKALHYALHQASNKSIQLELVNELPSEDILKIMFSQGYRFASLALQFPYQNIPETLEKLRVYINKCNTFFDLQTSVLGYSARYMPQFFLTLNREIKSLNKTKLDNLDYQDFILILKVYWLDYFSTEKAVHLDLFLLWAERVKLSLGDDVFLMLYDRQHFLSQKTDVVTPLQDYIQISQLLLELEEAIDANSFLKQNKNLPALLIELTEIKKEYYSKKFPEKPLQQALEDFAKPSTFVKFPLSKDELDILEKEYRLLEQHGEKYIALPQEQLSQSLILLAQQLSQIEDKNHYRAICVELLAGIREMVRKHLKLFPYNTQILAILALTNYTMDFKGRIGQIGTGEGKSLIVAMLVVLQALQGKFVDVITSSRQLAIRDQEKFSAFYQLFKLGSSHICYDHPEQACFHGQILYGTNYDFEFSIMRDALFDAKLRYSKKADKLQVRTTDVAIVDEADNLFIDAANNSARLAVNSPFDFSWVYPLIAEYVRVHTANYAASDNDLKKLCEQLENFRTQHHAKKPAITFEQLKVWYSSARKAFFELQLNRDYVIEWCVSPGNPGAGLQPKITIVDYQNTGRLNTGSRWSNGLHEFTEIKHNILPEKESLTAASMSHPAFFAYYQCVFGLTGTIGEQIERQEIKDVYNVNTFDVPRHRQSQRTQLPAAIYENISAYQQAIINMAVDKSIHGQPVLILLRTIKESIELSNLFTQHRILHQVLNEQQDEDEDYLIGRAGMSGTITLATNTAGRGTDILLSADSKNAGGLHVIFAFYPANLRVEDQGLGRAGRQGQPGTCCLLLHLEDDEIIKLIPDQHTRQQLLISDNFIETLQQKRSLRIQKNSQFRKLQSAIDTIHHDLLKLFFTLKQSLFAAMNELPLTEIAASIISQLNSLTNLQPITSSNILDFNEYSYEYRAKRKMQLLLDSRNTDVSEWKSALKFVKKALLEKINEEWAVFFTDIENNKSEKKIYQGLHFYQKDVLKKIIDFFESNIKKYFFDIEKILIANLKNFLGVELFLFNIKNTNDIQNKYKDIFKNLSNFYSYLTSKQTIEYKSSFFSFCLSTVNNIHDPEFLTNLTF